MMANGGAFVPAAFRRRRPNGAGSQPHPSLQTTTAAAASAHAHVVPSAIPATSAAALHQPHRQQQQQQQQQQHHHHHQQQQQQRQQYQHPIHQQHAYHPLGILPAPQGWRRHPFGAPRTQQQQQQQQQQHSSRGSSAGPPHLLGAEDSAAYLHSAPPSLDNVSTTSSRQASGSPRYVMPRAPSVLSLASTELDTHSQSSFGASSGLTAAASSTTLDDAGDARCLELLSKELCAEGAADVHVVELWGEVAARLAKQHLNRFEFLNASRNPHAKQVVKRLGAACFGIAAAGVSLTDEDAFDEAKRALEGAVSIFGFLFNAKLVGAKQATGFVRTLVDGVAPFDMAMAAANFAALTISRAGELECRPLSDTYAAASERAMDPRSVQILGETAEKLQSLRYSVQAAYRTVQVSGIDAHATEHELLQLLRRCGELVRLRLCGDRKAPCVSGHFVFKTAEGAERLMAMDGERLGRMRLKTTLCTGAVMGKAGLQGFGRHRKIRDTDLLAE